MNKRDKEIVRKAMDAISSPECDVVTALGLLGSLVGVSYPVYEALKGAKSVPLTELGDIPEGDFGVPYEQRRSLTNDRA